MYVDMNGLVDLNKRNSLKVVATKLSAISGDIHPKNLYLMLGQGILYKGGRKWNCMCNYQPTVG
jgi:hypothetical protein